MTRASYISPHYLAITPCSIKFHMPKVTTLPPCKSQTTIACDLYVGKSSDFGNVKLD